MKTNTLTKIAAAALVIGGVVACGASPSDEPAADSSDALLVCGQAFTCCADGFVYRNTCCGRDGSPRVRPCSPGAGGGPGAGQPGAGSGGQSGGEDLICGQAFTCCADGFVYRNTCCGRDGSQPERTCDGSGKPGGGKPGSSSGTSGTSGIFCGQAFTCCDDGFVYPNTCCGRDGSPRARPCD